MTHVVKASGAIQNYSAEKHRRSIQRSLYAVHVNAAVAHEITDKILHACHSWRENKAEVTTLDLKTFTAKQLTHYDKDAAMVYKKHKDIW